MLVTNNKNIKKMCSFYVSDFHLEMIILPYIEEKMKEDKKIKIITENNLEESMKILLSKINLKNKDEILKLDWNNSCAEEIDDDTVVIINGTEKYIENKNKILNNTNKKLQIINCYKFEEVSDKMNEIIENHDKVINSLK